MFWQTHSRQTHSPSYRAPDAGGAANAGWRTDFKQIMAYAQVGIAQAAMLLVADCMFFSERQGFNWNLTPYHTNKYESTQKHSGEPSLSNHLAQVAALTPLLHIISSSVGIFGMVSIFK